MNGPSLRRGGERNSLAGMREKIEGHQESQTDKQRERVSVGAPPAAKTR